MQTSTTKATNPQRMHSLTTKAYTFTTNAHNHHKGTIPQQMHSLTTKAHIVLLSRHNRNQSPD